MVNCRNIFSCCLCLLQCSFFFGCDF